MKTVLLAAFLLAATPSAFAGFPALQCRSAPGSHDYVGGLSVTGDSYYRTATFSDNYVGGHAVCDDMSDDELVCVGLWKTWRRSIDPVMIRVARTADEFAATFRRARFHGGATVQLCCTADRESQAR
jgi:hypothetical protein